MSIDQFLSNFKDYHLPISVFVFIVGSVIHWFHGIDAAYVAFTGTVLGAITGHAFSGAGQPDPPTPDPPVPTSTQNGPING